MATETGPNAGLFACSADQTVDAEAECDYLTNNQQKLTATEPVMTRDRLLPTSIHNESSGDYTVEDHDSRDDRKIRIDRFGTACQQTQCTSGRNHDSAEQFEAQYSNLKCKKIN